MRGEKGGRWLAAVSPAVRPPNWKPRMVGDDAAAVERGRESGLAHEVHGHSGKRTAGVLQAE